MTGRREGEVGKHPSNVEGYGHGGHAGVTATWCWWWVKVTPLCPVVRPLGVRYGIAVFRLLAMFTSTHIQYKNNGDDVK